MQRILLYEFLSSGGLFSRPDLACADALRQEGRAMLVAVANDFAALADGEIVVLVEPDFRREWRPENVQTVVVASAAAEAESLAEQSAHCDWTLLIAPEFDGLLHQRSLLI